jgi:hypothetical protein
MNKAKDLKDEIGGAKCLDRPKKNFPQKFFHLKVLCAVRCNSPAPWYYGGSFRGRIEGAKLVGRVT